MDTTGRRRGEGITVELDLGSFRATPVLPAGTALFRVQEPVAVGDVPAAVAGALAAPIGSPSLGDVCRETLSRWSEGGRAAPFSCVIVISDHSRPVPYKGANGILWPLISHLQACGVPAGQITLLVATGTHHPLTEEEIWALCDGRVREAGVRVRSHDAADRTGLVCAGSTRAGVDVWVERVYAEAHLRILTGLVEPHFMAGASGGRKSICPGLLDVQSVRDFHGPHMVASESIGDLRLEGNPCHQAALEIASLVPPHLILNVTMRPDGGVAGVFAGEMQAVHREAVEHLRSFAEIRLDRRYDIVITHGARVGINHYQVSKAMGSAAPAVREGGYLVVAADTTDSDPVGSASYRRLLAMLARLGGERFQAAMLNEEWEFVQDQWAVQMLARLLEQVPREHSFYFSPQTSLDDLALLPSVDPTVLWPGLLTRSGVRTRDGEYEGAGALVTRFVEAAVSRAMAESQAQTGTEPTIACLVDGPYGVPRLGPVSGT